MAKGDAGGGGGNTGGRSGTGYFPALYQSTVDQTGQDYDSIMEQYRQLGTRAGSGSGSGSNYGSDYGSGSSSYNSFNPSSGGSYSPIIFKGSDYRPGPDLEDLRELARTGGFSDDDIGSMRSRAVAPTRSIYDSANQNLLRRKSLQGGYSPNFGAISAKMARESSDIIGQQSTNANAAISEMVQRGKLSASMALGPLEARENERFNAWNRDDDSMQNQINMFNAREQRETDNYNRGLEREANFENNRRFERAQDRESSRQDRASSRQDNSFSQILDSIRGQQSLYGTTPGLASTFGNQVLNAANTVGNFPPIHRGSVGGSASSGGAWDERRQSY